MASRLTIWAERAAAAAKIASAISALATLLAGLGIWATSMLRTLPITLLLLSAGLLACLGMGVVAIAAIVAFKRHWKLAYGMLVFALLNVGLAGCVVWLLPPKPTWTLQPVPYERTIQGDTPLVEVKHELLPPGFPGGDPYREKLAKSRPADPLQQQFVLFVSSVFTRNRFPVEARVKTPGAYALAAYVFAREHEGTWKRSSVGFSAVSQRLDLVPPPGNATEFVIALVVFPLTKTAADESARPSPQLQELVSFH